MKRFAVTPFCLLGLAVALFFGLLIGPATAEEPAGTDFRVSSGIFRMGETKPASKILTVFSGGKVYDVMFNSDVVTIFDPKDGSFLLVDGGKKVQTVATKEFVDKAIERLVQEAADKKDPENQFFFNPQFESTQKDTMTGDLLFRSPWLTYRVNGKQGAVQAAKQYHQFANAYARLNTILNPGSKPPFARMLVNKTLAKRTLLPKTILITYGKESDPKAERFRSEHRYEMGLSETDRKHIELVKKSLEKLKVVPFEEYLKSLSNSSKKR